MIMIRWHVSDRNLPGQPISLSYSDGANGPWQPISSWLANSGAFSWVVGTRVPPKIFIRLTARDAAGNVTHQTTPQPVIVDLSKPSAKITDVYSSRANGLQK